MTKHHGFDVGADGNIITRPLLGYTIAPVADTSILARLEYAGRQSKSELVARPCKSS